MAARTKDPTTAPPLTEAEADRLPSLDLAAATAYCHELGFTGFTERTLLTALSRGELLYKLVQGRRAFSRASVRAWLILGLE